MKLLLSPQSEPESFEVCVLVCACTNIGDAINRAHTVSAQYGTSMLRPFDGMLVRRYASRHNMNIRSDVRRLSINNAMSYVLVEDTRKVGFEAASL